MSGPGPVPVPDRLSEAGPGSRRCCCLDVRRPRSDRRRHAASCRRRSPLRKGRLAGTARCSARTLRAFQARARVVSPAAPPRLLHSNGALELDLGVTVKALAADRSAQPWACGRRWGSWSTSAGTSWWPVSAARRLAGPRHRRSRGRPARRARRSRSQSGGLAIPGAPWCRWDARVAARPHHRLAEGPICWARRGRRSPSPPLVPGREHRERPRCSSGARRAGGLERLGLPARLVTRSRGVEIRRRGWPKEGTVILPQPRRALTVPDARHGRRRPALRTASVLLGAPNSTRWKAQPPAPVRGRGPDRSVSLLALARATRRNLGRRRIRADRPPRRGSSRSPRAYRPTGSASARSPSTFCWP